MNLSLGKIIKVFPRFNIRCHDNNDFWRVAKCLKIIVKEEPLLIDGYYKIKAKKPHILINSNLKGIHWTLTAFHELAHHLLDVPYKKSSILLYRDIQKIESKADQRAEAIALILTIPLYLLREMEATPFEELAPLTQEVLKKRQYIFENNTELEEKLILDFENSSR